MVCYVSTAEQSMYFAKGAIPLRFNCSFAPVMFHGKLFEFLAQLLTFEEPMDLVKFVW
jgi:hypothetical protein